MIEPVIFAASAAGWGLAHGAGPAKPRQKAVSDAVRRQENLIGSAPYINTAQLRFGGDFLPRGGA